MGETLIPTHSLRYQIRSFPRPDLGEGIGENRPVLQQRFVTPNGKDVWHDVPTVEAESS